MAAEPCNCGYPECRQCGPLQGSKRCKLHGELACSRCEEYYAEHGEYPESDPPDPDDWDSAERDYT